MRKSSSFVSACLLLLWVNALNGQSLFKHLTPAQGLNNETIRGIAQDKYGFMWFGSANGLFRYDGISIRGYYGNRADSNSLVNNMILSLYCGGNGHLWIGQEPGLCRFNYASGKFIHYATNAAVYAIAEDIKGTTWLATSKGLKIAGQMELADPELKADPTIRSILNGRINDVSCDRAGNIFIATGSGLVTLNIRSGNLRLIGTNTFPGIIESNDVQTVSSDASGRVWFSTGTTFSMLYVLAPDQKSIQGFNYFMQQGQSQTPNRILKIYTDRNNRVWIGSTFMGLSLYNDSTNRFTSYTNEPGNGSSLATDFCPAIFQDKHGLLWVSTVGSGVDFFYPDRNLFVAISKGSPGVLRLPDNWARAAAEDDNGDLWLGTAQGISVYHGKNGITRNIINSDRRRKQLHSTSIRSLLNGGDGSIWIGTAEGLNRIFVGNGQVRFYEEKDSMPRLFIHTLEKRNNGNILIGTSRGLFEYDRKNDRFSNFYSHPVLGKYARNVIKCIREDAAGRWWLGMYGAGVLVYDTKAQRITALFSTESKEKLNNNIVNTFLEDGHLNMWIGTRDGLSFYNSSSQKITTYTQNDGMLNTWICGLQRDRLGRIWIGTGNGLCVMNKDHKIFKVFGEEDGLPSPAFNDQQAYALPDGRLLFPSRKGFVVFDPMRFNWPDPQPEVYITSFKVLNKETHPAAVMEESATRSLRHDENFFSIELTSPKFTNATQCWFGYKLEGFDKDWTFTKERVVTYTNVPGGQYVFRYKSSTDPSRWNTAEKKLTLRIGTVFYQKASFLFVVAVSIILLGFLLYRFRLNKQKQILLLETKAELLEKEKTMVQYENLKQQLNPHFLFNSLSSLRSLIRVNPGLATTFLDGLSKTYRYLLRSGDNELVTLEEEIGFIKTFVQLQKTRFEAGLQLAIDLPDSVMNKRIAPVTIQGLIENAIKHNSITEEAPLFITIYTEADTLIVKNNLQRIINPETSNKKGLSALKTLYGYLSQRPVIVKEDGIHFYVAVPLL